MNMILPDPPAKRRLYIRAFAALIEERLRVASMPAREAARLLQELITEGDARLIDADDRLVLFGITGFSGGTGSPTAILRNWRAVALSPGQGARE